MTTPIGTIQYMGPELLEHQFYDEKVDIWAIGIMTYELLFGDLPFHGIMKKDESSPEQAVFREIKEQILKPNFVLAGHKLSSECKDFILKCLLLDPKIRPSAEELLWHPWLQKTLLKSKSTTITNE